MFLFMRFFLSLPPSRRRLNNDGRNGHLQPTKEITPQLSNVREGFFQGLRMRLTVSIPSERQEEQKLGADAGRFPKPERINVAIKGNYEARKD